MQTSATGIRKGRVEQGENSSATDLAQDLSTYVILVPMRMAAGAAALRVMPPHCTHLHVRGLGHRRPDERHADPRPHLRRGAPSTWKSTRKEG
eukprot:1342572-Pleurochrysis_carterae.AAC.2